MDDNNKTLKINISDEKRTQTIDLNYTNEIGIDEIKKAYIKNFKYQEKDKDKIILYYIDKEGDKNIINNFDELFNFANEVDQKNLSIKLFSELEKNEKKNILNDQPKNSLINTNKGNIVKNDIHNINNNENDIIYIKDKEIEKLKNEIYNLQKKNKYDFERYKNLIFYYEEFIKQTRNEKEKENNKNEKKENIIENNNINNENEKLENNIIEIENNINEKENNIKNNENEKNNNKINNEFKVKEIDKRNNYDLEMPNQANDLELPKKFNQHKEKWDYNNDTIQIDKNHILIKDIEFINKKCSLCHKKSENKIYKDFKENKSYICENCYNQNKKIYKDNVFEIKFPKKLLDSIKERKIKRKELGNRPIIDFNKFLNNIFFDNEGNFSLKEINEINDKDFSELKRIYDDMRLIHEDLLKYFADYQVTFINPQKAKLKDNEQMLIEKKLKLVMDNLAKLKI